MKLIAIYKNMLAGICCHKVLLGIFCFVLCNTFSYGQGTWTPLTHTAPHYNEGVMLVLTDGTILCKTSSGGTSYGTKWDRLTPDATGSYLNGTWTTVAAMANERLYFSTQVLNDGRVYVAGGEYGAGGDKSEVYNPLTNTWTACPQIVYTLATKISDANSEILANGKVLQAVVDTGGTVLNYLWDPATNTYAHTASCLRYDNEAAWLKLPDNSVLFIDNYSTTSERYIQSTNTWINDGAVPDELFDPYGYEQGGAFLLPNGQGFFIGSTPTTAYYTPSGSTSPGTWTAGPAIPLSLGAPDAASSMMPNGHILMALSATPALGDTFDNNTVYYDFNYLTNTFTALGAPGGGTSIANPTYVSNMVSLPDGTILYANQGDDQYYEFNPSTGPLAAGKPTLDSVIRINCDTFMATGLLFNGITEGASYGDDWQISTNYPIVRLTSGTNVYYARSYGWNRIGAVMTGAALDTTMFVIPTGLPAGTYAVQIVTNGNPSNTKNYNTSLTISAATSSLCVGSTETLSDIQTIGTWSSASAGIASVGSVTGIVTGVAVGNTTITYSIGACYSTATVTVNTGSATISGSTNVCVGATTTLIPSPTGGSWASSAPLTASIGSATGIVTGNAPGTATISYTLGLCTTTDIVTVNAVPTATITVSGSTSICSGSNVVLNAPSGTGLAYQWKSGGTAIAGATSVSYTASSAGNYTVLVSNAAGCSATSAITTVTLLTAPSAVITPSGSTTFCSGSSVVLNASAGSGLTYQWQSGGIPVSGATSIAYTATLGADYTVVVTNTSGCSTTSAATLVTVTAGASAITGTTTVCSGSTTLLSDTSPGGTWSSSNIAVATVGTGGMVTGVGTGGIATITYSVSGCIATTPVTVNSATAAAITGSASACVGQTTDLTDGTPGGTWSSSAPGIATVGTSGIVTGIAPGSATITYAASTSCGTAAVTRAVTVNASPYVSAITGTLSICSGITSALADVTPSGVWASSNTSITTISTSGLVTSLAPGVDTISYSVTNLAGCTANAIAAFTVFSSSSATITAAGPTIICTGADVVLNASSGTTYQWMKNGLSIAGATTSSYTANTTGNYTVHITLAGGCTSTSAGVAITVNPATIVVPSVAISASPGPVFCVATSPATFTAVPTNGGSAPTYQWYVNGAATATGGTFSYTPTAGDHVKTIMSSSNICAFPVTASGTDTISVSANETPSVTVTGPSAICTGSSETFAALPVYGGTAPIYRWTKNGISVATGPDYIFAPATGDVLMLTLVSNYPCLSIDSAQSPLLHISTIAPELNSISISVTQSTLLSGSVDTFIAIAPNGGTSPAFQWLANSLPIAGATNSIYIANTLTSGEIISCKVTSDKACATPATATSGGITVNVLPSGVQQLNQYGDRFSILPNPNKGSFTIAGSLKDQSEASVDIVITNMLGQGIYKHNIDAINGIVNVPVILDNRIANGMYLINITSGEDHIVFHLEINR